MVTRVPTEDRRGWDTVGSMQTLTGALVTAPRGTGVLSTRSGRAPAGAMVKVPEALTPAGEAAPAGSVRPAGIPQMDYWQLPRCRSGSRSKPRLDKQQLTSGKLPLHSIAGERLRGRDTEVNDGRQLEAGPACGRDLPPVRVAPQAATPAPPLAASSAALPRAPAEPATVQLVCAAPKRASLWFPPPSLTLRRGSPARNFKTTNPERPLGPYARSALPYPATTPAMFI